MKRYVKRPSAEVIYRFGSGVAKRLSCKYCKNELPYVKHYGASLTHLRCEKCGNTVTITQEK